MCLEFAFPACRSVQIQNPKPHYSVQHSQVNKYTALIKRSRPMHVQQAVDEKGFNSVCA